MGETIFALSSASGKAGVSVIRVSGAAAWKTLEILSGKEPQSLPAPRHAKMVILRHPVSRETVDQALVIGFQAPHSFTGEHVVEYHCHGSPAVLAEMTDVLGAIEGVRLAEHGEFTQ